MTLNELIDKYFNILKNNEKLKVKTIKRYLKNYLDKDISKFDINEFRKVVIKNDLVVSTVVEMFKVLNKIYYKAYKDKVIEQHYLCIGNNSHLKKYYDKEETDKIFEVLNKINNKSAKLLLLTYESGISINYLLVLKKESLIENEIVIKNIAYKLDEKLLRIINDYKSTNSKYLFSKSNGEKLKFGSFRAIELYIKIMTGIYGFKIKRFESSLKYLKEPVIKISYKELCKRYFEQFMVDDYLEVYELNKKYISPYLEHLNANEIVNEDIEQVFISNQEDSISNYRNTHIYYFLKKLFKFGLDKGYSIFPSILGKDLDYVLNKYPPKIIKRSIKLSYPKETFKDLSINLLSPFSTVCEYYFNYVDKDNRITTVNAVRKVAYPYFKDKSVSLISEIDVINLLKEFKDYYEKMTVFPIKCLLRKLFRYINDLGLNNHDFKRILYLEQENSRPLIIYNNEQLSRIIKAASCTCYKNLIVFAISSGLRFNEAIVLKWDDINLNERYVYVNRTYVDYGNFIKECEGNKKRKIYLTDIAYKSLIDSINESDGDYVFINKEKEKYLQKIKIFLSTFIEIESGVNDFKLCNLFNSLINSVIDESELVSLNSIAGYQKLESLNQRLLKLEDNYLC